MLKDSEVASKLASQPQLKPVTSSNNTRQNFQAKDLTATLMEANVNQMKNSQTFSNFNSFQPQPHPQPSFQPTWRPQQNIHQQPAFMVRFFFHVACFDIKSYFLSIYSNLIKDKPQNQTYLHLTLC